MSPFPYLLTAKCKAFQEFAVWYTVLVANIDGVG